MKWNKYSIKTLSKAEDLVISALADAGVEGAEIVDAHPLDEPDLKLMFGDVPPDEQPEDDGTAVINFYLEPDADNESVLKRVKEELDALREFTDIGECAITASETEDKDWINNWKEYFHSFRVDDIYIVPTWEEPEPLPTDKMVLRIDPGTAFGTGLHETTQLCIKKMREVVKPGCEMLDIGTGSGILAIIAARLGASHILGTDLDENAVFAVADNKANNNVDDARFELLLGNITDDPEVQRAVGHEKYDVVTANLLAEILIPMAPAAAATLKKGGIIITSGIIDFKKDAVSQALTEAGLKVVSSETMGEWCSVCAVKE